MSQQLPKELTNFPTGNSVPKELRALIFYYLPLASAWDYCHYNPKGICRSHQLWLERASQRYQSDPDEIFNDWFNNDRPAIDSYIFFVNDSDQTIDQISQTATEEFDTFQRWIENWLSTQEKLASQQPDAKIRGFIFSEFLYGRPDEREQDENQTVFLAYSPEGGILRANDYLRRLYSNDKYPPDFVRTGMTGVLLDRTSNSLPDLANKVKDYLLTEHPDLGISYLIELNVY